MRLIFLGVFWMLFLATASSQKGPYTEIDLEDVRTMAMVESKNILISFGSSSSAEAQSVNQLLLSDKSINKVIQESLISVSVDMDNVNDFKWFADFRIVYVPTLAIINPLGEEIDRITGNITTDRVRTFFDLFKEVDPAIFLVEDPSAMAVTPPETSKNAILSEPIIDKITEEEVLKPQVVIQPEHQESIIELSNREDRAISTTTTTIVDVGTPSTSNTTAVSAYKSAYKATINRATTVEVPTEDYTPSYRVVYASEGADFPPVALSTMSTNALVKKAGKRKNTTTEKSKKEKPKKKNSTSKKETPKNNQEFRIHFGTYDTMVVAQNHIELLKKSIDKEIQLVEKDSGYNVITRDLESKSEARSFVQESRAQGINCFLLKG